MRHRGSLDDPSLVGAVLAEMIPNPLTKNATCLLYHVNKRSRSRRRDSKEDLAGVARAGKMEGGTDGRALERIISYIAPMFEIK